MTTDEQLRNLMSRNAPMKATLHWVEVIEVNEDNGTMDVKGVSDELEYYDVSLGCGSVVLVPEKGSLCTIAILEGVDTECLLISAERVERVKVKASTEIVFNEGKLGGLVKVQELTDIINGVIDKFNSHTHNVAGVTPGSGTVIAPAPINKISKMDRETIENKSIMQ